MNAAPTENPNALARLVDRFTGRTQERAATTAEIEKLQSAVTYLTEQAYSQGPYQLPPEQLLTQLMEYDSQLIDELIDNRLWETLGGGLWESLEDNAARIRAISDSQRLWVYSPVAQWQIWTWTNYGLGDAVNVAPSDSEASAVIKEFWEADRNNEVLGNDKIHDLSNFTLIHGNTFLACFASTLDGITTVEEIPYNEITEIIRHPHQKSLKLFYKREFVSDTPQGGKEDQTIYYLDWGLRLDSSKEIEDLAELVLPPGAPRAEKLVAKDGEQSLTDVVVLHIAHNKKVKNQPWGWPLLTAAVPYVRAHKRFMEDRLTVAASKAMFTRRKKVTGNVRALASIKNTIASSSSARSYADTNPPPTAGSIELDNEGVQTTDVKMNTGAADARQDNEMFMHHALLGGGLFPTTAGLDAQRWATALQQDKTLAMQWARYRTFWVAQFERLIKIVLFFAEEYGNKNFGGDYTAQINIDSLSLVDFPDVVDALSTACRNMLKPYLEDGLIADETAQAILRELWLLMLQALGIGDSRGLASKQAFQVDSSTQEEALPPLAKKILKEARKNILPGGDQTVVADLVELLEEMSGRKVT